MTLTTLFAKGWSLRVLKLKPILTLIFMSFLIVIFNDCSEIRGFNSVDLSSNGFSGELATAACVNSTIPRRVRMLSRKEYDASVAAILGTSANLAQKNFPAENRANGFSSNEVAMVVSSTLANALMTTAETLASAQSAAEAASLSCTLAASPTATVKDPCAIQYITNKGAGFYRRPLTSTEVNDLYQTYLVGFQNPLGTTTSPLAPKASAAQLSGLQTLLAAFLQAPQFLYRTELGDPLDTTSSNVTLTQYEIASELSFLATGTPPDSTLVGLAATGKLNGAAIKSQYTRLLNTPQGMAHISDFILEWLGADKIASMGNASGALSSSVAAAMAAESQAYIQNVIFNSSGTFNELLSGSYTFLNSELAAYYGIQASNLPLASSGTMAKVVTGSQGAANATIKYGLLSQGAFLISNSTSGPNILHRGNMLRQKLFCEQLPSVASLGLPNFVPPTPGPLLSGQSVRQQMESFVPTPPPVTSCSTCHQYFMPLGFALENFDSFAKYRTVDNGASIDPSGLIAESRGIDPTTGLITDPRHSVTTPFADFPGFVSELASNDRVNTCFVTKSLVYSSGRSTLANNDCMVSVMKEQFGASGNIVSTFLAYLQSPYFLLRTR